MHTFRWSRAEADRRIHEMPAEGRIYIISDIHLGDGSHTDIFVQKDKDLLAFLDQVESEDATLIVAGDAIDFSQAWFFKNILRAHGKILGRFSHLASRGKLVYILGNHDLDLRFYTDVLRIPVVDGVRIGQHTMVLHGYEFDPVIGLDLHGTDWRTRIHHLVERALETWIRLPLEHFYTFWNRIGFWAFHKAVLYKTWKAQLVERVLDDDTQRRAVEEELEYWTRNQLGDPAALWRPVRAALEDGPYETLITGHSHLPGVVELPNGRRYANSGSWTFTSTQYLVLDDGQLTSRDWLTGKSYGDRLYKHLVEGALDGITFQDWWKKNYLGLLRYRGAPKRRRALR